MSKIIFITGGAKSGKSLFAEQLAKELKKKVLYLATSIPFDDSMKNKVEEHKKRRPKEWKTIERYKDFHLIEKNEEFKNTDLILLDCITLFISSIMLEEVSDYDNIDQLETEKLRDRVIMELEDLLNIIEKSGKDIIVVTNEIGMGIVPSYSSGVIFRDIAGEANQMVASRSNEAYMVISGIPQRIK